MRTVTSISIAILAALLGMGCLEQEEFTGEAGYYAFAMTEGIAPIAEGDEVSIYMIETRVELPLRQPNEDELAELAMMPAPPPFPNHPWVVMDDLRVEVDIIVTNLGTDPRRVDLTLDGFNEFHEYVPGISVSPDGEEVVANYSQWERAFDLEPGESVPFTITERDMDEIAMDLATVVNGAPNSNEIVYFSNQAGIDPRAEPYMPDVIPGLHGFRMGIRTYAASRVVVEASLRVRDMTDRLANDMETDENMDGLPDDVWVPPAPAIFMAVSDYEP